MHPNTGPDPTSAHSGDAIDGGDSLRLVKIRLALTLIAVAILPFAAVAPAARAVLDDTRTGLEERLAAEAEHSAADVRRELLGIGGMLQGLATSPSVTAALASPKDAANAAVAALGELTDRPSGIVAAVAVLDPRGAVRARTGATDAVFAGLPPPPDLRPLYTLVPAPGAGAALEASAAVPVADGPPLGSVVASISLADLVAWASPSAAAAGRSVQLVDGDGRVLASIGPKMAIDLPGTVIDMAANGGGTSEGSVALDLPGLGDLEIVARAPVPVTEIPLPAVATLIGLVGILIAFVWWMARQIIHPAAELEARRSRLHGLYEEARVAAAHDSLTGLGNHRAFQEAVTRMVDQSRRYSSRFSLVLLDIDEFKRINDSRGHATGDELLAEFGDLIRSTVRRADAGYRIGGDEFALLLAETGPEGAETVARRLLARGLDERPAGRYQGPISFSAGITTCPEFGRSRVELTAQADAALYRGKRTGRTVVNVFDPGRDRGQVDEGMRSELSAAVSGVIEEAALSPVYQPIVDLGTGQILGYEGLVRVRPDAGFAHTESLFDAAEVAGRVLELDRASLDVVLRGARGMPPSTVLSLNVSPRSFEASDFSANSFLAILDRHGVAPDRVLLELTERDAIRDIERLRAAIVQLQGAGVRIAADDVGAGNAGLRLLSQFRFDAVKIDLSLVQGGASRGQTLSVLTSLVQLARRFGALTIAEGVETVAQLQMIRQLDIDAGQGYLLGRPGPVLAVERIDLDALEHDVGKAPGTEITRPLAATVDPEEAAAAVTPTAAGAVTDIPFDGTVPGSWIPPTPRPTQVPPPAPTAASVIAGGAPNPFAHH